MINIYVGNLDLQTTEDELRREFSVFGEVSSVIMMNDAHIGSGQSRGYAYVEMISKTDGAKAIANLDCKKMRDRSINVVEALALSEKAKTSQIYTSKDNRTRKTRERV